jgi:cation:H+ antiporter
MTPLYLLAGFILLVVGAETLVRGASRLAAAAAISPLVIGLTVVAFGTSAPEMAVSATAAATGKADVALGNVIGSNIFNVLFILGISALIAPLAVSRQLVRLDVPLMVAASALTFAAAADGKIGSLDGLFLFAGLIAYTVFQVRRSRRDKPPPGDESAREYRDGKTTLRSAAADAGLILGGLGLLVLGSRWLVGSAVSIAAALGVDELIVGLTIVAAGTSLPEVATSVIASLRGERDIAVGNVVGSNLFNLLGVLGLSGLLAADGVTVAPSALRFDLPVMVAAAVACLPIFFTGHLIARWEGALFLGYYLAYTLYLVLAATSHAGLPAFSAAMTWFVLPLTAVTLVVATVRAARQRRTRAAGSRRVSQA